MSKTVEDLAKILREARSKANQRGEVYDAWAMDVAGTRAVIRALRDEMVREFERCDSCSGIEHVEPFFDEILGDGPPAYPLHAECEPSDRGQVAGVSVGNGETELDRTSGPAPATAPAPAVCVWTKGQRGGVRPTCSDLYEYAPYVVRKGVCPECKAPIKFTEAKT